MSRSPKSRPDASPSPAPPPPSPVRTPGWHGLLLGIVSGGIYFLIYLNPGVLWYVGVQHYDIWFADTLALLASNDAVSQGLNPYLPNPLDYFGRPHVYSHWWLQLRHLGLTRADLTWLGPLIVISFWLAALYALRPRTGPQFFYYLSLLLSSPIFLALDRANNDLIVFVLLAPLVPLLTSRHFSLRMLAPALIALAAGLKYYPAAAGLVLLASPPREVRIRVLVGAILLLLVAVSVEPDLAIFGPLAPKPSGWMSFGATTGFQLFDWTGRVPQLLCLAAALGLFVWGWRSARLSAWTPSEDLRRDWLQFAVGAALLSGCFFTSGNFAYRWVFALWLAPLLWRLGHDLTAPATARRLATATQWLLVAALWLDTAFTWVAILGRGRVAPESMRAWLKWSLLAEQPVTWALFACLLLFLARFARDGVRRLMDPGATV